MRDWILIRLIALSQFVLSLLFMSLALYGGPLFLLFGAWGFINSLVLLFASTAGRASALTWHIIFVAFLAYAFAKGGNPFPKDPTSLMLELWGYVALAAIYYLARVLGYLGNREN
jgi:hypothetical protein